MFKTLNLINIIPARFAVLSAIGLVLTSWYRVWVAGTVMVDGHGLSGIPEVIVFAAFIMSLTGFSVSFYKLWNTDGLEIGTVRTLAYVLVGIFALMLPMLSNDIYTYLVFGDAANKGVDVYTTTDSLHLSSYFKYMGPFWLKSPCAYGPVVLGGSMFAARQGGGDIIMALLAYKVLVVLCAVIFIEAAVRIGALLKASVRSMVFIILNPVFLIEGVGQFHTDIIAIALVISGIYFLLTDKPYLAFTFAALAVAAKMNYIIVVPFFVVALFLKKENTSAFLLNTAIGFVIAIAVVSAAYYPFYTSVQTFAIPFNWHFHQNPSKCIAEVIGDIVYFVPKIFGGNSSEMNDAVNSVGGTPAQQVFIWNVLVKISQAIAVITSLYLLVKFWFGKQRNFNQWFSVFARCLLLFLLFYLHIFNPWYLMMFLPFMFVEEDRGFMKWLIVLTCLIHVQDIVCSVSRDSVVYYIVLVLTFSSVMAYMWRFRKNFLSF